MNNARRKQIRDAVRRIEDLVQNILDDEQEAYDNDKNWSYLENREKFAWLKYF